MDEKACISAIVVELDEREYVGRRIKELDAELAALRVTAVNEGTDEEVYMMAIIEKLQEKEAAELLAKKLDAKLARHAGPGA